LTLAPHNPFSVCVCVFGMCCLVSPCLRHNFVEFATPLLFVSSTASANSLQVSRNFNNDMGKMKAWISGPRSQDYQNGQKTSKEMLVHPHHRSGMVYWQRTHQRSQGQDQNTGAGLLGRFHHSNKARRRRVLQLGIVRLGRGSACSVSLS
jgi:hypothetical protein